MAKQFVYGGKTYRARVFEVHISKRAGHCELVGEVIDMTEGKTAHGFRVHLAGDEFSALAAKYEQGISADVWAALDANHKHEVVGAPLDEDVSVVALSEVA